MSAPETDRDGAVVAEEDDGIRLDLVRAVQANVNDTGWARTTAPVR